jgi:2,3-bisphosphoglycerate-independent phosphoglycerate mutase
MTSPRPVILCILDGWGESEERESNSIVLADTPNWDRFGETYPQTQLDASEEQVGLPRGQMGNSEVGHMNLGAGRQVLQDLPRIDAAVSENSVADIPALQNFVAALKCSGGVAHLLGLISPGGVHSHQDHIAHLANLLSENDIPVVVHAFLDGRDTPPRSALAYMKEFQAAAPHARIGTVIGRYFVMDRDKNWQRVSQAYAAIAAGKGLPVESALEAIQKSYARNESDEFVKPTVIGRYGGMRNGDGLLVTNFRADRIREILTVLLDPDFSEIAGRNLVKFAAAVGMTSYSKALDAFLTTLFPALQVKNVLGEVISASKLKQLRIAETEKYAHVTFFFNGGEERTFGGEDRILIPSPKVTTYDLQPKMSAPELTDRLVAEIEKGAYDFIVVNFANPDMVGHTGVLEAAIEAIEAVDVCLGRLETAVQAAGGVMIVTADHGNVEMMTDAETGQAHTAHTMNKVPVFVVGNVVREQELLSGSLADIAPTLLELLDIAQPEEMTGRSLIVRHGEARAAE